MKKKLLLTTIALLCFYIVTSTYSSEVVTVSEYFIVTPDVSKDTKADKDIEIFFEYSDALYTLPGNDEPTDIFHETKVWDPLECINRVIFAFNINLAKYVIRPAATVYSFVVPDYVRQGVNRMDGNIQMPGRLINSLLQLKFERAGIELARFGINTTIGLIGFYDPAYQWYNMPPQVNNFGQTFAYWGIGKGFYIVLPIQGSTCLRNAIGLIGDYFTNPITYIPPFTVINPISWGIKIFLAFNNMTIDLETYLRLAQSSVDPYETAKVGWTIIERFQNTIVAMDK